MAVGWYVIDPPDSGVLEAFTKRVSAAMSGSIPIAGTMFSPQIPKLAAAMMGIVGPAGGVNATLPKVVANLAGAQAQSGDMASLMKQVSAAMVATQTQSGDLASTLPKSSALITGSTFNAAILTASVQKLQANLIGAQSQSGAMVSSFPKLSAAMSDSPSGPMASTIKAVHASLVGDMDPQGGIASTLPKVSAALAGSHAQSGSFASTMKTVHALLAAQQQQIGTMAPTLRHVTAAMVSAVPITQQSVGTFGSAALSFNPAISANSTVSVTNVAGIKVFACVIAYNGQNDPAFNSSRSCTYDTTQNMTEIAGGFILDSGYYVGIWDCVPTTFGSKVITPNVGGGGNTGRQMWLGSAAYANVNNLAGAAAAITTAGVGQVISSSDANEMIINLMAVGASFGTYSQTADIGPSNVPGNFLAGVMGHAAGGASRTFSNDHGGYSASVRLTP